MISNRMFCIYILQIFDIVISLFTLFNKEFCMVTSSCNNCDVKIFIVFAKTSWYLMPNIKA